MSPHTPLPPVIAQANHLLELGVPELLGVDPHELRRIAVSLEKDPGFPAAGALLVPAHISCTYADLVRLISHEKKPGFVVEDFTDAEDFIPVTGANSAPVNLPQGPWYLLADPQRGDEFKNASPAESLTSISDRNRVPLTMAEGIFWLLQSPSILERNHCFMTIGSRKPKGQGKFDARTPALWISNGTGRDGKENRNAPKLGWCWWNNRHTWLGVAHADGRRSTEPN